MFWFRRVLSLAVPLVLAGSCQAGGTARSVPSSPPPASDHATTVVPSSRHPYPPPPLPGPPQAGSVSRGWEVTVYYTAVQSFHHGPPARVTGCPTIDCVNGDDDLGTYPSDFVAAVHDEGTGLITDGDSAGRYLNWSSDTGYWLDSAPRDTLGRPLLPFRSAAADGLADGTPVRLLRCGRQDDRSAVPVDVCTALSRPQWQIRDAFTPGLGGDHHIDLYLGRETGPDFTDGPMYITLVGAVLRIG